MTYVQIYKQYVQILKKANFLLFFLGGGGWLWRMDNEKFYEEKKKKIPHIHGVYKRFN